MYHSTCPKLGHGICLDMYHLTARCTWGNCTTDGVSTHTYTRRVAAISCVLISPVIMNVLTQMRSCRASAQGHRARFVNRMKAQLLLNTLCEKQAGQSTFDAAVAAHAAQRNTSIWADNYVSVLVPYRSLIIVALFCAVSNPTY